MFVYSYPCHKRAVHQRGCVTLREESRDQQIDAENVNDV